MSINFADLRRFKNDGQRFQQLVRHIGKKNGFDPLFNGVGPDGGFDLIFRDFHSSPVYDYEERWLVQCKDNSHSNANVSEADVGCIYEKVIQHKCDGFLLACTTTATVGLTTVLRELDYKQGGPIYTAIWDNAALEAILLAPENDDLLRQFFPKFWSSQQVIVDA